MSDGHRTYMSIGKHFSAHSTVVRSTGEYAQGDTHSNTAESFVSFFERSRVGVFHFMSEKHLSEKDKGPEGLRVQVKAFCHFNT